MPRRIRPRPTSDAPSPGDEARREWLATWKRWAISRLPLDVSPSARVHVRAAVERALASLGPEDHEEEVRDVVLGMVEDVMGRMKATAEAARRNENKRAIITEVGFLLGLALRRFPTDDVVAMLKQPGYSLAALTEGLRRHLDRHVMGNEKLEEVMDRIVAWVERRLAEQPKPSRVLPHGVVRAGGAAVATLGMIALKNPHVRETVAREFIKAKEKARALWARWTTRVEPPTQP